MEASWHGVGLRLELRAMRGRAGGLEPQLQRVQGLCSRQSPLARGYRAGSELPRRCLASAWSQRPPPGRQRPGFICHAVVAALGRWKGLGLPPRGDGNAPFSASLERPPPRLESDHEVTLAPGLPPILGRGLLWELLGRCLAPELSCDPLLGPLAAPRPSLAGRGRGAGTERPAPTKGSFSAGGEEAVVWLLLSPPPPHITHVGETLAVTLLREAEAV